MTILFFASFILFIGAVLLYVKGDDTAFQATQKKLTEIQMELQTTATRLESFSTKNQTLFEQTQGELLRTSQKVEALDLELSRMKEKINKINVRATPTTHTVKLEISEPPQIKHLPSSLLNRAGIKKPKPKH